MDMRVHQIGSIEWYEIQNTLLVVFMIFRVVIVCFIHSSQWYVLFRRIIVYYS